MRKYQNISSKFQNNVTLSREEINFLIEFRREIGSK